MDQLARQAASTVARHQYRRPGQPVPYPAARRCQPRNPESATDQGRLLLEFGLSITRYLSAQPRDHQAQQQETEPEEPRHHRQRRRNRPGPGRRAAQPHPYRREGAERRPPQPARQRPPTEAGQRPARFQQPLSIYRYQRPETPAGTSTAPGVLPNFGTLSVSAEREDRTEITVPPAPPGIICITGPTTPAE